MEESRENCSSKFCELTDVGKVFQSRWILILTTAHFYIILPSIDTYGDISLSVTATLNGYPEFTIALIAPVILNTCFQFVSFCRLEKNKKYKWPLVLLQVSWNYWSLH